MRNFLLVVAIFLCAGCSDGDVDSRAAQKKRKNAKRFHRYRNQSV